MYVNEDNYRGYAGERLVEYDLAMKYIATSKPSMPGTPYDLTADINRNKIDLQVKIAKHCGYKIVIDFRKSHGKSRTYTESDFDILVVADLENRKVAYIPPSVWLGKTQITLWKEEPKSKNGFGRGKQPIFFDSFLDFPYEPLKEAK